MKIGGRIIRDSKISKNTSDIFDAEYKGRTIYITTEHGFGKPTFDHLKRFMIDVRDIKSGTIDVDTYEDFHTIRDAIIYALNGAQL